MHDPAAITLRPVETADLPVFFEQQLDPEANHLAAFVNRNPQDRAAFNTHWQRILEAPGIVNRTILRGAEVAGHIACYPQEGRFEVTYWLGKAFWGQGVATQALRRFLQEVSHRPLFARAAKDNVGSATVLQRCGFKIIGEDKGFAQARGEETAEFVFRLDGETPARHL